MEAQKYHQDEAVTRTDDDVPNSQGDDSFVAPPTLGITESAEEREFVGEGDDSFVAPPTLEIIESAEECEFVGEGDDFRCNSIGARIVVQISTGHLFHATVKLPLDLRDVRNLDLGLIDLTSVALDDIPNKFASFLAEDFKFEVELVKIILIRCETLWPEYSPSLTIAPEQMWEYCYIKRSSLLDYEADEENNKKFKELVLAEANTCEILRENPHRNIAKYWGCEVVDGTIRGLCFGRYTVTLGNRLDTGVPLDTRACLQGIRAGVAHLHSLGLAHNDINPYNIMMDPSDNPVIIDFDSCTREGEGLLKFGTPDWFPEGARIGSRQNDFYALRKMDEYLSVRRAEWS
ncbi:Ff.00g117640.m01.CDS01 [Fusarium sp. VM40]|nr:Ff.00g117640.m01.CDS01 [Fusarium sp. VM40]